MNRKNYLLLRLVECCVLMLLSSAIAQGTAFTYQGRLNSGGLPASGNYDFRFRLASDPLANNYVGSAYLTNGVQVANGLFATTIDFGAGLLTGSNYWLEVDVRTNGGGNYATLTPLQALTPTPYAIFAGTASNLSGTLPTAQLNGIVGSANLAGTYGNAVTFNNGGNSFTGDGSGLTGVNAATLNGQASSNFWQLGGNSVSPGQFLGSTNNQPLNILVNGQRGMRIEPTTNTVNIIGGWSNNFAAPGVVLATIAGGGGVSVANGSLNTNSVWSDYGTISGGIGNQAGSPNTDPTQVRGSTVGGGANNAAAAHYSTISGGDASTIGLGASLSFIGGGQSHSIRTNAIYSSIVGGFQNTIYDNAAYSEIVGGADNSINVNASCSFIGGGYLNTIFGNATGGGSGLSLSTIGGGYLNTIQTNANDATIAGGSQNTIQTNASFSTIGGGAANSVQAGTPYGTIGGGSGNVLQGGAVYAFVGAGLGNLIQSNSTYSTIAGGYFNLIAPGTANGTIGGGYSNYVNGVSGTVAGGEDNQAAAFRDAVGGGLQNIASGGISVVAGGWTNMASGNASTIGGGAFNLASGLGAVVSGGGQNTASGYESVVPGGANNIVSGSYGFAAGQQAQSLHNGSFVWADSQNAVFASTANDQFNVRAAGGVRLVTGGTGLSVDGLPVVTVGSGDVNLGASSSMSGGAFNTIQSGSDRSTISGGNGNVIDPSIGATIGGGIGNTVGTNSTCATVAGGNFNCVSNNTSQATIGGGLYNTNVGFAATIPGGYLNYATGNYSFAAGQQARALHNGAFVWSDSQGAAIASTAADQFLVRARGGVGINTNNPNGASLWVRGDRTNGWTNSVSWFENANTTTNAAPALRAVVDGGRTPDGALSVSANITATAPNSLIAEFGNAGSFVVVITNDGTIYSKGVALTSDRNAKEHFTDLDAKTVLAKVAQMPVTQWNYKEDERKHIGPTAQDFHAAFGLNGDDERHISVVDEGGVALAAIKGLDEKFGDKERTIQEQASRIQVQQAEIEDLKQRLQTLERIVLK